MYAKQESANVGTTQPRQPVSANVGNIIAGVTEAFSYIERLESYILGPQIREAEDVQKVSPPSLADGTELAARSIQELLHRLERLTGVLGC